MNVEVSCRPGGDGWVCDVSIEDRGRTSDHRVTVRSSDLARLAPGSPDPTDLVRRSFDFLLQREAPSSILREFDLMVIGRYFPEYEAAIRR